VAITPWNKALKELTEWMKSEQSDPQLIQAMITRLQAWYDGMTSHEDALAANQQSQLGWETVLDGWLSLEWQAQQDVYWAQW